MNIEFSKFGMKYGWLGKQAVLSVENTLVIKQYDEFIYFAKQYGVDLNEKLLKDKKKPIAHLPIALAGGALAIFASFAVAAPVIGLNLAGILKHDKKIEEQQYSCCVIKFYLEDLSKFWGL